MEPRMSAGGGDCSKLPTDRRGKVRALTRTVWLVVLMVLELRLQQGPGWLRLGVEGEEGEGQQGNAPKGVGSDKTRNISRSLAWLRRRSRAISNEARRESSRRPRSTGILRPEVTLHRSSSDLEQGVLLQPYRGEGVGTLAQLCEGPVRRWQKCCETMTKSPSR